ncbi:transporter substrate-binding domain-containing protein [Brenneria corticis]|uniref:ABC transporter substrate-binding protein n=1 Tax=Brenneria corticis TaxID=2173106 RepID=A0A2U1U6D3_9GAMM|nr:transporter substrate-binding domain-containing protein [Brenneria sp. CFCC 11842]PWC17215.1 ABC transporter substrate-binding protein [Brenneria sp. CFCC 11842]
MKLLSVLSLSLALSLAVSSAYAAPKTVNVAVEAGSKPLSFEDEKGVLSGYEVDVLKALDEVVADYDFKVEAVDASAAEVGLTTGRYAFIGGGLFKNPKRQERYLFPEQPNGASIITIYIKQGRNDINKLDDLVGKKVSPVSPNGGIFNLLTSYNAQHKGSPDKQIKITTAEGVSVADRYRQIDDGTYDALVLPNNLGFDDIRKELNLKVEAAKEPVQVNPTYFVLNKKETALKKALDDGLNTLHDNGTLTRLNEKWYGVDNLAFL